MDELVRRMRKNLEEGHRVEETWKAIGILASAVPMHDWDEAFELVSGVSRKVLAKQQEESRKFRA